MSFMLLIEVVALDLAADRIMIGLKTIPNAMTMRTVVKTYLSQDQLEAPSEECGVMAFSGE